MKTIILLITMLLLGSSVVSASEQVPVILHDEPGWVIDANENNIYTIFGEIQGFSAARFYLKKETVILHVIRNNDSHAQIVITDMPLTVYEQLVSAAEKRINAVKKGDSFIDALYTLDDDIWQEQSSMKRITLTDGSKLVVTFQKAKQDTLFAQTRGGVVMTIPDVSIVSVQDLENELSDSKYYRIDPNTSRMFFAPTGRGVPKGTGYFADYWVFFPTVAYGITSHFTLSGGMSILPGADEQVFHLAPKLAFNISPTVDIATGILYLTVPGEEDADLGLGFAVATFGNELKSLTLGVGIPITDFDSDSPLLLIGGETQVSNSVKLITENWIFPGGNDGTILFSGGIRFFGDKVAVDLALLTAIEAFEEGGWPFFPWVDFSYCFGK